MQRRKKISRKRSKKSFSKHANRTNKKNMFSATTPIMRGGYRL